MPIARALLFYQMDDYEKAVEELSEILRFIRGMRVPEKGSRLPEIK